MKIRYKQVAILLVVACALLAADASIIGSWDCTSTTPDGGEHSWKLIVSRDGDKLTGKTVSQGGEMPISDPRLDGDVFLFKSRRQSGEIEVRLTISGDRFQGTWKGSHDGTPIQGSVRGTRAK